VQGTMEVVVPQVSAPMFQVASTVPVYLGTLEMDSSVQVSQFDIFSYGQN